MLKSRIPVLGFAAYSGSGKTTLLVRLLPLLKRRGLRLGLIKHTHHRFEIDSPGKDSYELRKAGASQVLIGSKHRWALIVENESEKKPSTLADLIGRLEQDRLDLILVEGFKLERIPKIEVYRPSLNKPLLSPSDPAFIAIATDAPLEVHTPLPLLDLNQPAAIADFIIHYLFVLNRDARSLVLG